MNIRFWVKSQAYNFIYLQYCRISSILWRVCLWIVLWSTGILGFLDNKMRYIFFLINHWIYLKSNIIYMKKKYIYIYWELFYSKGGPTHYKCWQMVETLINTYVYFFLVAWPSTWDKRHRYWLDGRENVVEPAGMSSELSIGKYYD